MPASCSSPWSPPSRDTCRGRGICCSTPRTPRCPPDFLQTSRTTWSSLLCELERSRTPEAVDPLLERLAARLAESGDEPLRRAWSRFLGGSFLPRRFPLLFPEPAPEAGPLTVPAAVEVAEEDGALC